ncbi:hypothetical protein H2198_004859 [Neophaeococcomyces mojaviensis]|uniref:Uncharacterized protein n=1 Tax=Neophaeococcomyces mojaviensis TaxID=3383035 RepID=A0ACC3A7H2_9EURO|nr:hypothetical protein H2198_004859 [Knufia sp. JES_112]
MAVTGNENGFLKSTFPVYLPTHHALTCSNEEFERFIKNVKKSQLSTSVTNVRASSDLKDDSSTLVSETGDIREGVNKMQVNTTEAEDPVPQQPFMQALHASNKPKSRDMSNKMFTENADVAHASTKEPLVDLFYELEEVIDGDRLRELLEAAWQADPLSTLKIIFNARSIHIGKSSRVSTYKCFGWLAQNHPGTLLTNLQWLSRPIIEKKLGEKNKEQDEDDMVLVEAEKPEDDPTRFDVKNGVAHGYWKDLLNILALAVDGKLDVLANPRDLLNIESKDAKKKGIKKKDILWDEEKAKEIRNEKKTARHTAAVRAFEEDSFYGGLHLTVARLFAAQLKSDLVLLRGNDKKALRQISLCAKWAPSIGLFHDKYTFIVSSIAEILHPKIEGLTTDDRELYLRHAREAYRKDISALRKALEVVERDVSAETFGNIKYERVPSLAMNRYAGLFARKDEQRFDDYISKVAEGKKSISGATLLPSTLISTVRATQSPYAYMYGAPPSKKQKGAKALIEAKMIDTNAKVIDGQWNTLVKRIKDSGTLENSIAVCDVSGSMTSPVFADKSCPMDSAIGLSLLLAEVTKPPFGGSFITFSEQPTLKVITGSTLQEKVGNMETADWGGSTNFVAVFEKLILPQAREFKVKQEDMVKRIFVFSDMQFNAAESYADKWSTSYERIKKQFEISGYEMPELVFWNLAGGRAGMTGHGNTTAPKPVIADEKGTSLVSGYSHGMLKVFLDNGAFEDPEAESEIVEEIVRGEDGEEEVKITKKQKTDPMSTVRKAISHKSYSMLKVID